ncbi:hypothetical protein GCM10009864_15350 [Streptomyces lunalinharesii]|uniref:Uncharacterized protein n=1 Tax=Streptomyces lunalinharesii TaxID=333384 RepID=A0ABP6DTF4_9ACTN
MTICRASGGTCCYRSGGECLGAVAAGVEAEWVGANRGQEGWLVVLQRWARADGPIALARLTGAGGG